MKALPGLLALGFLLLMNPNSQAQTVYGSYNSFGKAYSPYGYHNYQIEIILGYGRPVIGIYTYVYPRWPSGTNQPTTPFLFLFTGVSSTKWGNISLPLRVPWFSLPPLPVVYGPCLQVSPDVISFPTKNRSFYFSIPKDPSLVGLSFYQQIMGFIPEQWKWTTWWSRPSKGVIGNR